jgi:very-short-patch-repair endonuclease
LNPKKFRRYLRKNQTAAESRLWSVLRNRKLDGRKFRRQHPIGKYIVDFYCYEENLVIEVDGSSHDNVSAVLYDEERDIYLKEQGLKVVRFRNEEIYHHIDEVLNEIKYNFN